MDEDQTAPPPAEGRGVPTLFDLCMAAFFNAFLFQGKCFTEALLNLPAAMFESLLSRMPPAGLLKLGQKCARPRRNNGREGDICSCSRYRKRKRSEHHNDVWKTLCYNRFPQPFKLLRQDNTVMEFDNDWQRLYWQNHLQECFDEVSKYEQPFQGGANTIKVSDSTMRQIFCDWVPSESDTICYTLRYHCEQYGQFARCLRIESAMCVPKICDLLRTCGLITLVFNFFLKTNQIDSLCGLLKQNYRSLRSLCLCTCNLSCNDFKKIYWSLCSRTSQSHKLEHLFFSAAMFKKPTEFLWFLHGESVRTVCFSSANADRNFAKNTFLILLNKSSPVALLDLSRNVISGWLSDLKQDMQLFLSPVSLRSLRTLNLRGAFLTSADITDLKYAMIFIPNLEALDLSENGIMDRGISILASCVAEMAKRNRFLRHLALENCGISYFGTAQLISTLLSLEKPLVTLSVARNILGCEIIDLLSNLINKSLVNLDFSNVGILPLGFKRLSKLLNNDLKLENINFSNNYGGTYAGDFILALLSRASKLQSIKASGIVFHPNEITDLHSTLESNGGYVTQVDIVDRFKEPFLPVPLLEGRLQNEHHGVSIQVDFF